MKTRQIAHYVALSLALVLLGTGAQAAQSGSRTYAKTCGNCHEYGSMGAPRYGDASEWRPRLKQGNTTLYQHAIGGFRSMPARGGNPGLSDEEVRRAVDHMVKAIK